MANSRYRHSLYLRDARQNEGFYDQEKRRPDPNEAEEPALIRLIRCGRRLLRPSRLGSGSTTVGRDHSPALIAVQPSISTLRYKTLNIFIKVCYSLPCIPYPILAGSFPLSSLLSILLPTPTAQTYTPQSFTKTVGGRGTGFRSRHSPLITRHWTQVLSFQTLAHSLARRKTQLVSFQTIAHSLPQNTRGGGRCSWSQIEPAGQIWYQFETKEAKSCPQPRT